MHMHPLSNFISIEFSIQELDWRGGGSLNPPWVKVWVKNTLGGRGIRITNIICLGSEVVVCVEIKSRSMRS